MRPGKIVPWVLITGKPSKPAGTGSVFCLYRDNGALVDIEQPVFDDAAGAIHSDNLTAQDNLRPFCGIDDRLRFGSFGNNFLFAHK